LEKTIITLDPAFLSSVLASANDISEYSKHGVHGNMIEFLVFVFLGSHFTQVIVCMGHFVKYYHS